MGYDSDKSDELLDRFTDLIQRAKVADAMSLLRHAEAGGCLRCDSDFVARANASMGVRRLTAFVNAFAIDPCPFCRAGREVCEECNGRGTVSSSGVCQECAGLGLVRCLLCNGTSVAGYDLIPRVLRMEVLRARCALAEHRLHMLRGAEVKSVESGKKLAARILEIDQCRGMLANAVERARMNELGAPGGTATISKKDFEKLERHCRRLNAMAELAIRSLLIELSGRLITQSKRAGGDGRAKALLIHKSENFARLAQSDEFEGSPLQTPHALTRAAIV